MSSLQQNIRVRYPSNSYSVAGNYFFTESKVVLMKVESTNRGKSILKHSICVKSNVKNRVKEKMD